MKRILFFVSIAIATACFGQMPEMPPNMEAHIVVLLVRAANAPDMPKEKLDELHAAHIANIKRLEGEGKLLNAGPFEDFSGRNVRGMYIFNSANKDEVAQWVQSDPAVKSGRLAPEYLKWWTEKGHFK